MALLIFVVVTAVVLAIAAYAVGQTATRLAAEPPASLFEFDEAVEFVATALPDAMSSRLTYGDVRAVVAAHLADLERLEDAGRDVVFVDDGVRTRVAASPDLLGRNISPAEVDAVLSAEVEYLRAIGAVGLEAPEDTMPAPDHADAEPTFEPTSESETDAGATPDS